MTTNENPRARRLVWGAVLVLGIVHYDFWWWGDRTLLFGFLPIGLGFHALISILASITWAMAVRHAWPSELEAWASEGDGGQTSSNTETGRP